MDATGLFQQAPDFEYVLSAPVPVASRLTPSATVFVCRLRFLLLLGPADNPVNSGPDWETVLDELRSEQQAICASGPVAPSYVYVDEYSSRGKTRVRLRATGNRTLPGTHQKTRGLGKVGGADHRDWAKRCDRRNRLQKIERRAIVVQQWIEEDRKSGDF